MRPAVTSHGPADPVADDPLAVHAFVILAQLNASTADEFLDVGTLSLLRLPVQVLEVLLVPYVGLGLYHARIVIRARG